MTNKPSYPLLAYSQDFHSHKELTRAHLNGKQEKKELLLPSFFPPASFWTSSEKDLFFHGLSIFSRFRPDLIAEHIKTKSTLDVCVYLDALHAASLQECPNLPLRNVVEPATEVSERWVEHEESLATKLAVRDDCSWSFDRVHVANPQAQTSCLCPGDGILKRSGPDAEASRYLSHLDSTCLTVMESLIRESEPEDIDVDHMLCLLFTENSTVIDSTPEDHVPGMSNNQSNDSLDLADQPMETNSSKLSRKVENELYHQSMLRRRLRKRLHMRRKRAEQTGRTIASASTKLRPGRPKKHWRPSKTRLKDHNNRGPVENDKLEQDGDNCSPVIASEISTGRASSESADHDIDQIYERHGMGGITKPYQIKALFHETAMDGQTFSEMDLNFFHLSTLGRLLRLYNSVSESPRDSNDVSISAQTIQLMVRITKEFVSEVMRHAIISKEQEIRLKRSLRVWTYDRDEINSENVAECLTSMGLSDLSKEHYFSQLLKRTKLHSTSRPHVNEESGGDQQPSDPTKPPHLAQFILPQSLLWCSLPHYQQFFPADEMLPEPIDQELRNELTEEDAIDMEDEIKSKDIETFLWERIGMVTDTNH